MKMYLVRKYRTRIEEIEVTRFNATSYWTAGKRGEQRSSRFTSWESAFPTWIDAKEFIVQRLTLKIESLRSQLVDAEKELSAVGAMIEPTLTVEAK
jgi:hypothetical protein